MLRFTSPAEVPPDFGPSAVTIGKFDGVHAGHRAVIDRVKAIAAERSLASAVVTFDRNPLSLLAPDKCPAPLLSNEQKLEALDRAGLDATLMLTFDLGLSATAPEEFVKTVIVDALHAAVVLVGADFRFGAKGAGNVALLQQMGPEHGFETIVIDDVTPDGERRVSSTWVRELLSEGRAVEATQLLGELPSIRAEIVHGQQRGRELGYPTANLAREVEGFVPADGVYAAWVTIDGERYPAAVSIGNNPTFGDVPERQIEAHLIDQQLDLYGKTATVSFVEFVRGMRKFPSADALAEQMGVDERWIRDVLGVSGRHSPTPAES